MTLEIEKKFLVNVFPEIENNTNKNEILQGYVIAKDKLELRLRKKSGKCYQTIKTGEGLIRGEYEIEITTEQFDILWPLTENKRIEKTRYDIYHNGFLIELDVYKGSLAGLITAEVEFDSESQIKNFKTPEWFGEDITLDKRYKNRSLASIGLPK